MTSASQPHPRGLPVLFFTEMWERMSYYGMRALLVLFLVDSVDHGGLGLTEDVATALYGLYTAGVYLAALPGGWIADRLLGHRRAVTYGGCLIAAGHFTLLGHHLPFLLAGLLLIVLGTGLLKPSISTLVGLLYPEGGARRDSGFTLFYLGINLGAAIGPLLCSALGEKIAWHYGFGAAGVGMILGLIQYRVQSQHLGDLGTQPVHPHPHPGMAWGLVAGAASSLALVFVIGLLGWWRLDPVGLARNAAGVIAAVAIGTFAWMLLGVRLGPGERGRVGVILILFLAAALFWSGYEQAGSSLNLFAERFTERRLGSFEIPAGWFQSVPAVFVVVFAPVVAAWWVHRSRRGHQPLLITKLAWGLILLALSFGVLQIGSRRALDHGTVWPTWLLTTYLLQVLGELLLSPVGLSAVTQLAPSRFVGQMMGLWFLAASLGNLLAGLLAGQVTGARAQDMPVQFFKVFLVTGAAGLLLWLLARPLHRRFLGGLGPTGSPST
ncbi:MAG: peptide MFS transporter [Verrucomicrobia bacterium]|nr:peptide MFS transporter [Verrucomicrobiota bacterium]